MKRWTAVRLCTLVLVLVASAVVAATAFAGKEPTVTEVREVSGYFYAEHGSCADLRVASLDLQEWTVQRAGSAPEVSPNAYLGLNRGSLCSGGPQITWSAGGPITFDALSMTRNLSSAHAVAHGTLTDPSDGTSVNVSIDVTFSGSGDLIRQASGDGQCSLSTGDVGACSFWSLGDYSATATGTIMVGGIDFGGQSQIATLYLQHGMEVLP